MAEVVTHGSGEYELLADRAQVRVTYAASAADRSGAVTALGERVAGVNALLAADPMANAVEVRQRSIQVGDKWQRNRREGASAQLELLLRTTQLEVLDDLIRGLLSAQPERLDGPYWWLADESDATREAQLRAIADARARAEAYADAVGATLGAILRVSDTSVEQPYPLASPASALAEADDVSSHTMEQLGLGPVPVTVRATCTAAWSLLD